MKAVSDKQMEKGCETIPFENEANNENFGVLVIAKRLDRGCTVMAVENLCLGYMSDLKNPNAPCPNCGWLKTMRNAVSQLQAACTLTGENQTEKYIVGRTLGQGGFGISCLVWNTNRNERGVVKEFFPATIATRNNNGKVLPINAKDTAQFKHELDNCLKEAHKIFNFNNDPNVVSVKNFFQANNTAYIVMEYIDGQTPEQVIQDNGGRFH